MYKTYSISILVELRRALHKIATLFESHRMYKYFPRFIKKIIKNRMQMYLPKPYRKLQYYITNCGYLEGKGKIKLIIESSNGDNLEIEEDFGTTYIFTTLKLLDKFVHKPELLGQILLYKLVNFNRPRKVGLFIFVFVLFAASAILIHYTWIGPLQNFELIPDFVIMLVLTRLISEEQRNFYIETDRILYEAVGENKWRNFVRRTSYYNFLLGPYVRPSSITKFIIHLLVVYPYGLSSTDRITSLETEPKEPDVEKLISLERMPTKRNSGHAAVISGIGQRKELNMRHKRLLILLMCLIASCCLYLWLSTNGETSNFGLNAFTETLGILVTVLIVDHLIKRQEELRTLPQKATAYEDVRLLTTRIVGFWADVCHACVPEASPASVDELFSHASFDKMNRYLNLDSQPNVDPPRTWWDWLVQSLFDHRKRAETILERHNNVLDPNTYALVHQIATEGIEPSIIQTLRQSDQRSGFPRPHILGSYCFLPENYCETVVNLVSWCEAQVMQLESNGIAGLKRVSAIIGPWDRQDNPPSMIDDAELLKQLAAVQQYREINSSPKGSHPELFAAKGSALES